MKKHLTAVALLLAVSALFVDIKAQYIDTLTVYADTVLKDEPLFDEGQPKKRDFQVSTWQSATEDGISVNVNLARLNRHGRYYLVDIALYNDSYTQKGFDFKGMRLVTPHHSRKFMPLEKYLGKQKKKGFWKSLFSGIGIWFAAMLIDEAINKNNDTYESEVTTLLITEAAMLGTELVTEHFREGYDRIVSESIGYLRNVIVEPGRSLEGFALIPRRKTKGPLTEEVPYGGKVFRFTWEKSSLETLE